MLTAVSSDLLDDADRLEAAWGIPVAMEMLREHLITPLGFFELCEESVEPFSDGRVADAASPAVAPQVACS